MDNFKRDSHSMIICLSNLASITLAQCESHLNQGLNHSNSFAINGTISPASLHVIHNASRHCNTLCDHPPLLTGLHLVLVSPVTSGQCAPGATVTVVRRNSALVHARYVSPRPVTGAPHCALWIHLTAECLLDTLLRLIITL